MSDYRILELPEEEIELSASGVQLGATLTVPPDARGLVIFVHGSGSSRFSSRNKYVANTMNRAGLGTLLMDLLTPQEEAIDNVTRHLRFDIGLLADRVSGAVEHVRHHPELGRLGVGLFGASTGAAAALIAAARHPETVRAVVSRGGRPDLANGAISKVKCPTQLIVGSEDGVVVTLNEQAYHRLRSEPRQIVIIQGAGHLFEEPGTLDEVAKHATEWFAMHLNA